MDKKKALQELNEEYTVIRVQPRLPEYWPTLVLVLEEGFWSAPGEDSYGFNPNELSRWAAGPYAYELLAKPVS
jgi:hypothetical protein